MNVALSRLLGQHLPAEAYMVFSAMLTEGDAQWTSLSAYVDSKYYRYHDIYKMDTDAAWALTCKAVLTFFRELRKVRVIGQDLMSESSGMTRSERFARVTWASLRAIRLHREFIKSGNYYGHASMAHVNAEQMLKERVSKASMDAVTLMATSVQTGLNNVVADTNRLLAHCQLESGRPGPARARGSGRGGRGGGGT